MPDDDVVVKDSNGTRLLDGDSVRVIGTGEGKRNTSVTLRAAVRNIRLNGEGVQVECNAEKVKGLVLKSEFLKKA